MSSPKPCNNSLHILIKEAAWNGQSLAEAINVVGRESGLPLNYSRSSVGQWLAGMKPRRPVPNIVAEVLSRRLGRSITPGEIGFDETESDVVEIDEDPVERLIDLAVAADSRSLRTSAYRICNLAGLSVPRRSENVDVRSVITPAAPTPRSPIRVGASDIEAATAILRMFAGIDAAIGAGHIRPALSHYLANTIAPYLRASSSDIRADFLAVAARLACLCGSMCYDDELRGFAQRYYHVTFRLSEEANDTGSQSMVLRAMSELALSLGHCGHALKLARAAVDIASTAVRPPDRAALLGQLAVARAATGDRVGALADIKAAQGHLERGVGGEGAVGVHHEAALAYQRGVMLALLGDGPNALVELAYSVRHHPARERRSRAIALTRLADLQLRQGLLDQSVGTWHRFLDDYPAINSGRARTALGLLHAGIRPYQARPGVNALLARATSLQRLATVTVRP